MPRKTKEFNQILDYQEAQQGRNKGPVFFGHRNDLHQYYLDIDQRQEQSDFFGRVLYPESQRRQQINGGIWDYEKIRHFGREQ